MIHLTKLDQHQSSNLKLSGHVIKTFYVNREIDIDLFIYTLQVHQRQVAGTPRQIFEIDAGGDGWLVPWVKENAKMQLD